MSTGQVKLLRRDYPKYSRREYEYYKNEHCGEYKAEVPRGQSKGSESVAGTRKPPEKKRKFSPIVWDIEEKKVRVLSKIGVEPASVIPERKRKSPVTYDKEEKRVKLSSITGVVPVINPPSSSVVSDGVASEFKANGQKGSEDKPPQMVSPADLLTPEQEKDQTRIPLARLQSESDSPSDKVSCISTPEIGEIRSEDSFGDKITTCSADEKSHSLSGDGGEEIDENENGDVEDDEDVDEPNTNIMFQGCRSVDEYTKLDGMLGEGTYGVVYRARDNKTGDIVAIKRVKTDKCDEGFPITSLREINILLACNHSSIVGVKEVVVNKNDDIFMVMEYVEYELKLLTEAMAQRFSIGEVKYLMKCLLEGVKYLHDKWVLHRDLKTTNLLLNKDGELKICDLGLSRQYTSPLKPYTSLVVTLWYRAPELLLGQKKYSTAIDMWSVGCIMAELLAKEALFKGETDLDQLNKIFETLGKPNEKDWPGVSKLPVFKSINVKQRENLLRKKFAGTCFTGSPMLSASGLDLLTKLLTYDPEKRITADDAVNHSWFKDYPEPRPVKPSPSVHDRYMVLRKCQEREYRERVRRGSR